MKIILAIRGDSEKYNDIIDFLKKIGGINENKYNCSGELYYYYIDPNSCVINKEIRPNIEKKFDYKYNILFDTIDTVEKLCHYKFGDKVYIIYNSKIGNICAMKWDTNGYFTYHVNVDGTIYYNLKDTELKLETELSSMSDGYHTFDELYEYRLLYNAAFFNELAEQGVYDVHKSKKESDGKSPFNNENMFVVMAELPTGQISNHYEMKYWNLFNVPIKDKANVWDNHTSKDVCERIRKYLFKYPKTYSACLNILDNNGNSQVCIGYRSDDLSKLQKLLICRDAYIKLDNTNRPCIYGIGVNIDGANIELKFPDEEMKNEFYNNFKEML